MSFYILYCFLQPIDMVRIFSKSLSTEMGKTDIRKLNILIKTGMKQRQS